MHTWKLQSHNNAPRSKCTPGNYHLRSRCRPPQDPKKMTAMTSNTKRKKQNQHNGSTHKYCVPFESLSLASMSSTSMLSKASNAYFCPEILSKVTLQFTCALLLLFCHFTFLTFYGFPSLRFRKQQLLCRLCTIFKGRAYCISS